MKRSTMMIVLAVGFGAALIASPLTGCNAERLVANDRYDDGDVDSLSENFGDFSGTRGSGGGGVSSSGNSDDASSLDDYDDYPYAGNSESAFNYPDFGLKSPKKKDKVFPKVSSKFRTPESTLGTTMKSSKRTTTTIASTTTTTTTTTPAPATTRKLFKYTRHRVSTTTTTAAPKPADNGESYEIEEYDTVEVLPTTIAATIPTASTAAPTTTTSRRPHRKTPSTPTARPQQTASTPSRRRRKPVIANSSSHRNEIRVRRPGGNKYNHTGTSTYAHHFANGEGFDEANVEALFPSYESDDPMIESASQHSASKVEYPRYPNGGDDDAHQPLRFGYNPLQEYEYSFRTKHPVQQIDRPKQLLQQQQQQQNGGSFERTSYEDVSVDPYQRLLFSTDMQATKYSAPDGDYGYFLPMANPLQTGASSESISGGKHPTLYGKSGGFQPVHADFASDLNVADLPLESFPSRLNTHHHQFNGMNPAGSLSSVSSPTTSGTSSLSSQHHHTNHAQPSKQLHHHFYHYHNAVQHPHSTSAGQQLTQQHHGIKPSSNTHQQHSSATANLRPDDRPASVLVYAETAPFKPSEPILFTKPGTSIASPEQIELYNNDLRDHYEALVEKQLKNSPDPADRAKYHQFLKAKQDERHEQLQAKRQQQPSHGQHGSATHSNRYRPPATAGYSGEKPQYRPKQPYTTPGLRHYRKPQQSQHFASDRSYEFPFVK